LDLHKILVYMPAMLKGTNITIILTVVSLFFGVILGLFIALGRLSKNKIIDRVCWLYIWLFRGTPLLMQLIFIYAILPLIFPVLTLNQWTSAFVAYSLNSAAYLAEIIRAAIQSIDKGQMEAAKALGMGYGQAMKRIIVPQSYRRLIPPVGNEFIALLKDSSLVIMIGMVDLMNTTNRIASNETFPSIYLLGAAIYLAMTTIFTLVFEKLEKKYSVYE